MCMHGTWYEMCEGAGKSAHRASFRTQSSPACGLSAGPMLIGVKLSVETVPQRHVVVPIRLRGKTTLERYQHVALHLMCQGSSIVVVAYIGVGIHGVFGKRNSW